MYKLNNCSLFSYKTNTRGLKKEAADNRFLMQLCDVIALKIWDKLNIYSEIMLTNSSFTVEEVSLGRSSSSNRDLDLEPGHDPYLETPAGALQDIAFKCGTKVLLLLCPVIRQHYRKVVLPPLCDVPECLWKIHAGRIQISFVFKSRTAVLLGGIFSTHIPILLFQWVLCLTFT